MDLVDFQKEQQRLHTFKPDLNDKSLKIADKKKYKYSTDIYDNTRDPISKLRQVDMREHNMRPSSAYSKKTSVLPYRSGVYVLDPSVLEEYS